MRLVCPNCEAKYEVPEDAIPETGRDVQCANCGHAWYQMRSRAAVAETVAPAPVVAPPSAKAPEPEPAPVPEPTPVADTAPVVEPVEPEPEVRVEAVEPDAPAAAIEPVAGPVVEPTVEPVVEVQAEPDPVEEPKVEIVAASADPAPMAASVAADPVVVQPVETDADEDLPGDPPAAAAAAPAAYAVDESVLAILREEAEREALARKADVGKPLEVQADLGIESAPAVKKKPVEVISTDADPMVPAEDADDKLAGRRTRLPDVEEINSTLRPSEQLIDTAVDEPGDMATEGRSSFRSGFLLVMTLAIVGAALYISADALAEAVPALAGVLKAYVGLVDGLRLQLDGLMQSATVAINGSGP